MRNREEDYSLGGWGGIFDLRRGRRRSVRQPDEVNEVILMRLLLLSGIALLMMVPLTPSWAQSDFLIMDNAYSPKVAVDNQGHMHVGGTYMTTPARVSFVGVYDSTGRPVRQPITISEYNYPLSTQYPVVVPGNIRCLQFWNLSSMAIPNSNIRGRLATLDGDSLTSNTTIDDGGFEAYHNLGGACWLSDSTFIVVWTHGEDMLTAIRGRIGSLSAPRPSVGILLNDSVSHSTSAFYHGSNVATSELADRFAVVWNEGVPYGDSVKLRIFFKSGVAIGPSIKVTPDSTYKRLATPLVAMHPNGDIVVTWTAQSNDGTWNIYTRRYSREGIALSNPTALNTTPEVQRPQIAIASDVDGKDLVVWDSGISLPRRIRAQKLRADGSPDGVSFLAAPKPDSVGQYYPSLSIRYGRAYLAWEEQDQIRGRIFSLDDRTVSVHNSELSRGMALLSLASYPNPFNSSVRIEFRLSMKSEINVAIYNLLGQEIAHPFVGLAEQGTHLVEWNASSQSSGIYLCRMIAGNVSIVQKLLVIR